MRIVISIVSGMIAIYGMGEYQASNPDGIYLMLAGLLIFIVAQVQEHGGNDSGRTD